MNFGEVFNMKKRIYFLMMVLVSLFFCSCEMDPAYSTKPDSYYFNKMQPLEWKDTYILTATNTPQQIQVWDSEKGKLVHTYSLSTDVTKWGQGTERALDIFDMTVINKSVWIICSGKQRNLIKLDVETGEMKLRFNNDNYLFYLYDTNYKGALLAVSLQLNTTLNFYIIFNGLDREAFLPYIMESDYLGDLIIDEETTLTLDNAFEYSVNKLAESPILSWTQQTAIYTGVNTMTTQLGVSTPTIAMLIVYWFLLTIIYIIIDIIIKLFTWLTHMVGSKSV